MARITRSTTVTLDGTSISLGELREILDGVEDSAILRVSYFKADTRDPRERDYVTLSVTL